MTTSGPRPLPPQPGISAPRPAPQRPPPGLPFKKARPHSAPASLEGNVFENRSSTASFSTQTHSSSLKPLAARDSSETQNADLISRTAGLKWKHDKDAPPVKKGAGHYALKWAKKNGISLRSAVKEGLSLSKRLSFLKKTIPVSPHLNAQSVATDVLKNIYKLHKEIAAIHKINVKRSKILNISNQYKTEAQNYAQTNSELSQQYEALSAIALLVRDKKSLGDAIVKRSGILCAAASGLSSAGATIAFHAGVIGAAAATIITTGSAGVGVALPAALGFAYGVYKLANYSSKHAQSNYWERTLYFLETNKAEPDTLKDNKLCKILEKKMLKKGLNLTQDPQKYEKMRAYAFNQCLQRKKSFAIEYLKEALIIEHNSGQDEHAAGSAHALLKELGLEGNALNHLKKNLLPKNSRFFEEKWEETVGEIFKNTPESEQKEQPTENVSPALAGLSAGVLASQDLKNLIQEQKPAAIKEMRNEALKEFIGLYLGFKNENVTIQLT